MTEVNIRIDGMTCHHCVMAVKKELSRVPNLQVKEVKIGGASVAYDEAQVDMHQIEAAIEEAGYKMM